MTTVGGISNGGYSVNQINSFSSVGQTNGAADSDGDNDGGRRTGGAGRGNAFVSAIAQALSQIGVSASGLTSGTTPAPGATTSTTPAVDPQQALGTFMHDLFAALQAQNGGQSGAAGNAPAGGGTDSDGDNDGSSASAVSGTGNGRHHHGHGGMSNIQSGLQNLIQQLSSSTPTDGTATPSPANSTLQQDFQNLLGALGQTSGQANLGDFLKAIADNLQGSNPGLNLSAKA